MKSPAKLFGLLLAALAVSALAEDKPFPPAPVTAAPAIIPTVEPKKADAPAATPPALSSPNEPAMPPAPFSPLAHPTAEEKPSDPDLLELPKMVVKQKPRPRLTPEIMVTKKAFGEDLARQKFSTLDQILNKYTLPLFGTSLATRALEDHEREKKQQLNQDVLNITKALETVDPTEAKSLKDTAARP